MSEMVERAARAIKNSISSDGHVIYHGDFESSTDWEKEGCRNLARAAIEAIRDMIDEALK